MYKNIENVFYSKLKEQQIDFKIFNEDIAKSLEHRDIEPSKDIPITSFPQSMFSDEIGTHPDFLNEAILPKNQYVCCIFMDISGSTDLALKYSLSEVQKIKNAILSTGIDVFKKFGGHIHRLQGDALFVLTGHQALEKSDSIIQALNASAVIQHFNESILAPFFEKKLEVNPPSIRIGIDFGDDDEVLWANYGIENISEITVTSLHADLSSKLQHEAPKNGVMIGENVYQYLQLPTVLLSDKKVVHLGEEKIKYYIIMRDNFNYKMKIFDWKNYLDGVSHYNYSQNQGDLCSLPGACIKCFFSKGEEEKELYMSNKALPKNVELEYKLILPPKIKEMVSKIRWKVYNYGYEAEEVNQDKPYLLEEANDKYKCYRSTAYNGLHFMQCSIYGATNKRLAILYFSLYVNDNENSLDYLKKVRL